ncbi:hypothetical protein AYI70_g2666 [Smittium culicis]|uniref:Uncharacterized protein n=1 Tax=Smittium culicis TaxID=133412 RepID=A0A1R1Y775_9FUNG|nr:hypothetical protein AYI70_g4374 [Smittium culicis]OMJ22758.1 hypothetical protein AYI70_g2666 [Smittium culicis]
MKSKSTGFSPAEMLFGFQIRTPMSWQPKNGEYNYEESVMQRIAEIKVELPEIRKLGIDRMVKVKNKEKSIYDKKVSKEGFKIGELILKSIDHPQKKLEQKWDGPYKIEKVLEKGTYWISDKLGNKDLVHGDRLKKFNSDRIEFLDGITPLRSNLRKEDLEFENKDANRGRLELKGGVLSYNNSIL